MGQFTSAEKLMDPIAISVTSGQRQNYVVGPCTMFRVKRDPSSAGTLRFVTATVADGEPTGNTTGYALTEDDPDSGWILADATFWIRVYGDSGNVAGECATKRRI